MSTIQNGVNSIILPSQPQPAAVDAVSDSLTNLSLQSSDLPKEPPSRPQNEPTPRPFITYSRSQLLFLHKSPLVKIPNGMPAFKDWFGTESDQNNAKKDSEVSAPSGHARDRRFRRDVEDGAQTRPSFRGTAISQPPQMGNFKHQSIRTADRDRERDVDKEVDRDSKVKDGHERLRNLSEKYDRDRRAISSLTQLRPKDRDPAQHHSNSGSRVTSQGQQPVSGRAIDARESSKKKDGESTEDWRRGTEPSRAGRERSDIPRKERDDRDWERPRSRARDSSRTRREGSLSRRERDGDRDRRTDREDRLGDGLAGYRRDRDDRDKEYDRESEADDPRRWRDDGKRDERMAARREREAGSRDRLRERSAWDTGERSDRRWVADDRDGQSKRTNGRNRRAGDDVKDREERKDREREKEPAWMDTYIPSNDGSGFGMQRANGELDGIQAFKKELREKERGQLLSSNDDDLSVDPLSKADLQTPTAEGQLDEIQLFKLMMKREEEKRKAESPLASASPGTQNIAESTLLHNKDTRVEDQESKNEIGPNLSLPTLPKQGSSLSIRPGEEATCDSFKSPPTHHITSPSPSAVTHPSAHESELLDTSKSANSRFSQTPSSSDLSSIHETAKPSMDVPMVLNQGPQSNPTTGSRLLALGSRSSQNPVGPPRSAASQSPISFSQKSSLVGANILVGVGGNPTQALGDISAQGPVPTESFRPPNGFYPFDDRRDGSSSDTPFHSLAFPGEQTTSVSEQASLLELGVGLAGNASGQPLECVNSGVAAAKGSRFAKFFDGKGREGQGPLASKGGMGNLGPLPPTGAQKVEIGSLNPSGNAEARAMEDIFAMLNNSAHAHRLNTVPDMPNFDHLNSHSGNLHPLQAQPNQQQHPHGRLDSLYDSRLDDRNFVPDGMVPGLRMPLTRGRQNSAMFSDIQDDPAQFNVQRGAAQMYQGAMSSMHLQHANVGRPVQAPQFRGGPSPNSLTAAQRLPPGLANLGGRPPHDPSQFINPSMGITNGGMHSTLHGNVPGQQPFGNYQQGGFGGGPQLRLPHPAHQLQSSLAHNPLQGLVHPGYLGTSQVLGLAGAGPGGLRGPNPSFGQGPQAQPQLMGLRQHQPQQQIPPQMLPLFQQQGLGGASNQPAHDLMTLLINGTRRPAE
ncbi:hypothetical protein V8B97DRAFT_1193294 [Scleroderma yunnanense]